jgi:hypothetical protein
MYSLQTFRVKYIPAMVSHHSVIISKPLLPIVIVGQPENVGPVGQLMQLLNTVNVMESRDVHLTNGSWKEDVWVLVCAQNIDDGQDEVWIRTGSVIKIMIHFWSASSQTKRYRCRHSTPSNFQPAVVPPHPCAWGHRGPCKKESSVGTVSIASRPFGIHTVIYQKKKMKFQTFS